MLHDDESEEFESNILELIVAPETSPLRLDRFLADQVPDLSRSLAQQLIADGLVQLNQKHVRPSELVRPGDQISINKPAPKPVTLIPQAMPLTIVYEDNDLVVVDKPTGLVVHPAPGHPDGTLVNGLLARYPDWQIGGEIRPGIVHRIDRDTSGLLVVAKNDRALRHLQDQQQARTMHKGYIAVVEGPMKELSGTIDAPIARHPNDRLRMAVVAHGRPARTHWHVNEILGTYTLLDVRLETGRTHQIRVHFAFRQRPILGDPLYGPRKPRTTFGLNRQFLHAYQLGFRLPSTDEFVRFQSDLPNDLVQTLDKIRQYAIQTHAEVVRIT
jgi:23S rRNA pseudouridine1911/1915/1917 synthase